MKEYEKALALAEATVNLHDNGVETLDTLLVVARALIQAEGKLSQYEADRKAIATLSPTVGKVALKATAELQDEMARNAELQAEVARLRKPLQRCEVFMRHLLTIEGPIPPYDISTLNEIRCEVVCALTQDKEKEENDGMA